MAWFSVMPGETEDKKMGEKKTLNVRTRFEGKT